MAKGIRVKKDKETELRGQGITSGRAAKLAKASMDADAVGSKRKAKKRSRCIMANAAYISSAPMSITLAQLS